MVVYEISITISPYMQQSEIQNGQVTLKVTQLANGGRDSKQPSSLSYMDHIWKQQSTSHMTKT